MTANYMSVEGINDVVIELGYSVKRIKMIDMSRPDVLFEESILMHVMISMLWKMLKMTVNLRITFLMMTLMIQTHLMMSLALMVMMMKNLQQQMKTQGRRN